MSMKNIWNKITVYCMNHNEPLKMDVIQNVEYIKSPFYACEHYATIPAEQRKSDSEYCSNRLGLDDYQGIVMAFLDTIADMGPASDMTNYKFKYPLKGGSRYDITVLKYTTDDIRLGILNKGVLLAGKKR